MNLHRLVEHGVNGVGGVHDRGGGQLVDVAASALADFHLGRRGQRPVGESAHGLDQHIHVGQHRLHHLEGADRLAELLAGLGVVERQIQRPLGDAQAERRDHGPLKIKPAHHDGDAAVLGADPILRGNAAILEHQFRRLAAAIAHLLQLLRDAEPGKVFLDDEGRNAVRALSASVLA